MQQEGGSLFRMPEPTTNKCCIVDATEQDAKDYILVKGR